MKSPECERLDHEWCQGEGDQSCDCHCHRPGSSFVRERARVRMGEDEPGGAHALVAAVLWVLAWLALAAGVVGAFVAPEPALGPSLETEIRFSALFMGVAGFATFAAAASVITLLLAIHARLGSGGGSASS